jgi:AcrR family transcriptional regulator
MESGSPKKPRPNGLRGRRAIQAEQTRDEILRSARVRFAQHGYAATSVKDIAADAGVSVQTVYDSVGTKADLVRRLSDLIDAEADIGPIAAELASEADPLAVARIPARITRRLVERCGDILRACLAGSLAEPGLLPLIEEGGRRHRAGAAAVAERLAGLEALREGLSPQAASRSIAVLADYRTAIGLIDDHHLDFDELETWIADTTATAILRASVGS